MFPGAFMQAQAGFPPENMPQAGNKASEKGRPISSNAVAGTPWCVVWTGDNKVCSFD
jgi:hypothetical protein